MKITKSLLERIKPVLKYCEYMDFLEDNKGDDPDFNREYWELKANLPKILEASLFRNLGTLLGLSILSPAYIPLDWKDRPKEDLPGPYIPFGLREDRLLKELQQIYSEVGLNKEAKIEDYDAFIKLIKVKDFYYVVRESLDHKQEIINNSQIVIRCKK